MSPTWFPSIMMGNDALTSGAGIRSRNQPGTLSVVFAAASGDRNGGADAAKPDGSGRTQGLCEGVQRVLWIG